MDSALLPPELNSGLMYDGPGAESMWAQYAGDRDIRATR
jgi:PPE-repeat protein